MQSMPVSRRNVAGWYIGESVLFVCAHIDVCVCVWMTEETVFSSESASVETGQKKWDGTQRPKDSKIVDSTAFYKVLFE